MNYRKEIPLRLARIIAILLCGLAVVSCSLLPIRAALWHITHRRQIDLGALTLILPSSWWLDSDGSGGSFRIDHAVFLSFSPDQVEVFPLPPEKQKSDEISAKSWQNAFANAITSGTVEPIEIQGAVAKIYCVRDSFLRSHLLLVCRIPGAKYGVAYSGSASGERSAEDLLSSLRVIQ
jgi:hypothetical protein